MATPLATAFVRIRPDTSKFGKETEQGLEKSLSNTNRQARKHGRLFGATYARASAGPLRAIGGVLTHSLAGVGAAFAAVGAVKVFSGFIADARESNKVANLSAAAIKSTGGAAHITAKQVGDLATAISNKTGKDDEAIQSGENLLLTFTNIRNQVGKGNDIFNQASTAIVDMTAALNNGEVSSSGLKSSSIQLGKALNDPIKGVTALRKVGVSFTDQQTAQIKKLTESGNILGAQKIILRELGKEFGGAAKASSNPMERLRVIVGNLGEQIGNKLIPYLDTAAKFIGDRIVPAIMRFIDQMKSGEGAGGQFVVIIGRIRDTVVTVAGAIQKYLVPILGTVAGIIQRDVLPVIVSLVKWINKNREIIPAVGIAIATLLVPAFIAWAVTAGAAAVATIAAAAPVIALGVAIAALAFLVIKNFDKIKGAFKAAFDWVKHNWPLLLAIFTGPIGLAAIAIIKNFKTIKETARTVFLFIANIFLDMIEALLDGVGKLIGVFAHLPGPLGKPFRAARDAINDAKKSVEGFQKKINQTHGKKVTVSVEMQMKNRLKIAAQQGVSLTISGKPIALAAGGPVRGPGGPTGDKVPAMLSSGEYVVKAASARKLGTRFLDMLNSAKSIGGDPGAAVLRFASGGSVAATQSFIRAQRGERYLLGGAGPNVWDCSGITGAAYAMLRGLGFGRGQRYFTTQSAFGRLGFKPGLGAYTIGVSPRAGHMVGNIGGLPFEAARPGVPLRVGSSATSVKSMAQQWFLSSLGGVFGGNGSIALGARDLRQIMKAIGIKYGVRTGVSPVAFDGGGFLPPRSATLAVNRTNRAEPVGFGNTYNINIAVPPSANQHEIGRQIVASIRQFEKGSGTGWRK